MLTICFIGLFPPLEPETYCMFFSCWDPPPKKPKTNKQTKKKPEQNPSQVALSFLTFSIIVVIIIMERQIPVLWGHFLAPSSRHRSSALGFSQQSMKRWGFFVQKYNDCLFSFCIASTIRGQFCHASKLIAKKKKRKKISDHPPTLTNPEACN